MHCVSGNRRGSGSNRDNTDIKSVWDSYWPLQLRLSSARLRKEPVAASSPVHLPVALTKPKHLLLILWWKLLISNCNWSAAGKHGVKSSCEPFSLLDLQLDSPVIICILYIFIYVACKRYMVVVTDRSECHSWFCLSVDWAEADWVTSLPTVHELHGAAK